MFSARKEPHTLTGPSFFPYQKRTDAQLGLGCAPLLNRPHLKAGGGPVLEQSNNRTIKTLHGFIRTKMKEKEMKLREADIRPVRTHVTKARANLQWRHL